MLQKLETRKYQVHLNGAGMSGRGVQFELLSPDAKRASDDVAVKMLPKDATGYQFFSAKLREGVKTFLRAVTDEHGLPSLFEEKEPTWHKLDYTQLNTPTNDYYIESGALFTTADLECLETLYKMHHEPNSEEVDKLFKGASPLA